MKYVYLALTSIMFLNSCVDSTTRLDERKHESTVWSGYSQLLSSYDSMFISHFPESINQTELVQYKFSAENGMSGYPKAWLVLRKSKKEIEALSNIYEEKYHNILNAADSNLLVINTWKSLKESGFSVARDEKIMTRLEEIGESEYPIPNFYELNLNSGEKTVSQLSSDFKIMVVKAEKGVFGQFDELSDRRYVPSSWEHGYSKGIAISKKQKLLIYWCAIW